MKSTILSTLRETVELWLRYIGVAVCFAVAGAIAIFGLRLFSAPTTATLVFALVLGFLLSLTFWRLTGQQAEHSKLKQEAMVVQGVSAPFFGVADMEIPQFATSASVVCFCMTYSGEQSQSFESPIQAPTTAPEVVTLDANVH